MNDPRAIATNGKGQIFIADHGNNRLVVLNEKDKSFAGSIPVNAPFWVGVDAKSGAVYAGSGKFTVIKFSGWENAKEVSRLDFAPLTAKVGQNVRASTPLLLALDASANPPVLWAGRAALLLRCEDQGDKFGEIAKVAGLYAGPLH